MKIQLEQLFLNRPEHPLFLVESGSRLWGIASPDSDYDVRGIHLLSKEQYYDYLNYRDVIEVMDGKLDYVSFEIDKAFTLLSKSNPSVLEWIRAHIVYQNNMPEWERFSKELLQYVSFYGLYHHYLSLAKGQYSLLETGEKSTYKVCFYAIRGILSAFLSAQGIFPELVVTKLFNQFGNDDKVAQVGRAFIGVKREHKEQHFISVEEKKAILTIFSEAIEEIEKMPLPPDGDSAKLSSLLSSYSILVKDTFYS